MSWLTDLGEKSSRTDVWVVLIVITYLACLSGLVDCEFNPTQIAILSGMFVDLGITTVFKNNNNGTSSK